MGHGSAKAGSNRAMITPSMIPPGSYTDLFLSISLWFEVLTETETENVIFKTVQVTYISWVKRSKQ